MRLENAENMSRKRCLVVLELTGVLAEDKFTKDPALQESYRFLGQIVAGNYAYMKRPGLQTFLARCFEVFDVAIWTCKGKKGHN
jgi:hypothetical protein